MRVYKFLNNKSTLLKLLPPTEDAFIQHLRRAALATVLDKTAHIGKPNIQPCQDCGWTMDDGKFIPVPSTQPAWPQQMTKTISCGCGKGCNKNCSCNKKKIPCYIGCRCQVSKNKCSRARCSATFQSSSESDSDN